MADGPVLLRASLLASVLALSGCYNLVARGTGGEESRHLAKRAPNPADVAVPPGYRVEVVATGFTYPVAVAFDSEGRAVVLEAGYSYDEVFTVPKLVRVERDGSKRTLSEGEPGGPWTGVVYHDGAFFVADGGESRPGRILRIPEEGGAPTELVTGLPTLGDHHTNGPAIGPDGKLYFTTGTATNSGIVGEDNYQFGWLKRYPDFHDVPCRDVKLTGFSAESANPFTPEPDDKVRTGAYQPFGVSSATEVAGRVPCSGGVFRAPLEGGAPELVAWGFRNPFGMAFSPEGALYVTENGFDMRGSRPIFGRADNLWRVEEGRWYGWPDYAEGRKVYEGWDRPIGAPEPQRLLAEDPGPVPEPVARFGVHSSSNGLDFSRSEAFGHAGDAFVAQFGDMSPKTGRLVSAVGFKVVRVGMKDGVIRTFAANRKAPGPASALGTQGLERPTHVRFSPDGAALYVVDFGVMRVTDRGPASQQETGVLWRIVREEAAR